MSSPGTPELAIQKATWTYEAWALAAILVLLLPWWIAATCPFIDYDDPVYVTMNQPVLDGLRWSTVTWAFSGPHAGFYFPLTWLSLALDVSLFGKGPVGLHVTNVLFHLLNTMLVYAFFRRTTRNRLLSLMIAVAWGIHPLRVESVVWVTERKDVLSGFFGMLSLLAYVNYVQRGLLKKWLILSGVLLLLALMSKGMMVTLPFMMLLADFWPLQRKESLKRLLVEKVPLVILALLWSAVTLWSAVETKAVVSPAKFGFGGRIATACVSCVLYLRDFFYFRDLALIYPGLRMPSWPAIAGSTALLVALGTAVTFLARRKPRLGKPLAVGMLWFFGGLLPVLGIIQCGSQARADRFTYFPAIGLVGALIWIGWQALQRVEPRSRTKLTALIAVSILMALEFSTSIRLAQWRDPVWLYVEDTNHTERNGRLAVYIGIAFQERGEFGRAEEWYLRALEYEPGYDVLHYHYGTLLAAERRYPEAIRSFEIALEIKPDNEDYQKAVAKARRRLQELGGSRTQPAGEHPPAMPP